MAHTLGSAAVKRIAAAGLVMLAPQVAEAQGLCFCVECVFGSYESYTAVSTSMLPTIKVGDCFYAQLPGSEPIVPEPGDIVVVLHDNGSAFAKRVVAVAGQTVQMIDGRLYVDDAAVETTPMADYTYATEDDPSGFGSCLGGEEADGQCHVRQLQETLPNGVAYAILDAWDDSSVDDTAAAVVPEGHVYVLGDNRDNSLDSRISTSSGGLGMVPLANILGVVDEIDS